MTLVSFSLILTGVLLNAAAQLLLKAGTNAVGPFEFAAVMALGSLGIPNTPALTAALLYHFAQVIPTIFAGFVAASALGLRVRDLSNGMERRA